MTGESTGGVSLVLVDVEVGQDNVEASLGNGTFIPALSTGILNVERK